MGYYIFIGTMLLIYARPFALPIWLLSTVGAMLVYVLNIVSSEDILIIWDIVKPSTLALIALILLALSFEKMGFFSHLATLITLREKTVSTWKFFIFFTILSALLSTIFANDGAILVLTPLVFILFASYKNKSKITPLFVFLLTVSFVSDFASNALIISNLTNIISAQILDISFNDFAAFMILPQLFAIFSFIFISYLMFKKYLPTKLSFELKMKKENKINLIFCYILLFALLLSFVFLQEIELYICLIIASFISSLYVLCFLNISLFALIKEIPFSIVIFSFTLFIVVYSLKNEGLLDYMYKLFIYIKDCNLLVQIFAIGFSSAFVSSMINNLPTVFLTNLMLDSFPIASQKILTLAHLLGCNIGSKLTPIGSLATLLWLSRLKGLGVEISILNYMYFAFFISIFVLGAALFGLYLSSSIAILV